MQEAGSEACSVDPNCALNAWLCLVEGVSKQDTAHLSNWVCSWSLWELGSVRGVCMPVCVCL